MSGFEALLEDRDMVCLGRLKPDVGYGTHLARQDRHVFDTYEGPRSGALLSNWGSKWLCTRY